jgi:hypothetical protein
VHLFKAIRLATETNRNAVVEPFPSSNVQPPVNKVSASHGMDEWTFERSADQDAGRGAGIGLALADDNVTPLATAPNCDAGVDGVNPSPSSNLPCKRGLNSLL